MAPRTIHLFRRRLLDRMVLRPTRDPVEPEDQQRVWLTVAGQPLECYVHAADPHEPVSECAPPDCLVLKFPGTQGRAERATRYPLPLLPASGLRGEVWTWNPPGYGLCAGRASLQRMAEASLEFSRQAIERRASASTKVILCGNSLGSVTALNVAARMSLPGAAGLVLRNPPPLTPVVKRIARTYPLGRLADRIAESLIEAMNAPITAAQVTLPAVFLQSGEDRVVPPRLQQQVHDAYAGEKRIVTLHGLDHHELPDESHEAAHREAIDWLWQRIG